MMGYWYGPGMMVGGWFMMFGFVLIVGLVIYFLFSRNKLSVNSFNHLEERPDSANKAFNILKERYARGEITTEEYNERKKELE